MARKKAAAAARKLQVEIQPQAPPEKPKRPPSPAAEDQICHLKALNGLLLKETMERREQVSHLNSLVGDLSSDHSFRSSLESEILSLLLSSLLSDEREKAEERASSSEAAAESALKEKERIKKEVEVALMDRDLKKNQAEQLEAKLRVTEARNFELGNAGEEYWAKLRELEVKTEDVVGRKEEEFELLIVQKKADADKRLALEEEIRRFKLANEGLEDELDQVKEELFSLKKDKDVLFAKVVDLDERIEKMLEELNGLRVHSDALKNEKEEGERMYQEKLRESSQKLDMLEAELLEKIEDIMLQNDEVKQERAKQDVCIAELQKSIGEYQSGEVELKRAINDKTVINTQLKLEGYAAEFQIGELREEVNAWRLSSERVALEFSQLQKTKEEGEKSFDLQLRNSVEQIDDLMRKLGEVEAEKDKTEQARVELEIEITRLRKESEHLGSIVVELKTVCVDHTTSISQLQTDRDATQRDLDSERDVVGRLKVQVSELEKGKEEMVAKLGILKAENDGFIREHDEKTELIRSLTAEKASLQKSLTAACDEIKGAATKMNAAEMSSEKSLSLVRSISSAMHDMQEDNENGIIWKPEDDAEVGEGIQPFVAELESIRKAFICKAGKVADLNNEVKLLQGAVADAHNNKGSLWTQFVPALSVLSIAAAGIAAYAAKVR